MPAAPKLPTVPLRLATCAATPLTTLTAAINAHSRISLRPKKAIPPSYRARKRPLGAGRYREPPSGAKNWPPCYNAGMDAKGFSRLLRLIWPTRVDYRDNPDFQEADRWYHGFKYDGTDGDAEDFLRLAEKTFEQRLATSERLDRKAEWTFGIGSAFLGGIVTLATTQHVPIWWFTLPVAAILIAMVRTVSCRAPIQRPAPVDLRGLIQHNKTAYDKMLFAASCQVAATGMLAVTNWKGKQLQFATNAILIATLLFLPVLVFLPAETSATSPRSSGDPQVSQSSSQVSFPGRSTAAFQSGPP